MTTQVNTWKIGKKVLDKRIDTWHYEVEVGIMQTEFYVRLAVDRLLHQVVKSFEFVRCPRCGILVVLMPGLEISCVRCGHTFKPQRRS